MSSPATVRAVILSLAAIGLAGLLGAILLLAVGTPAASVAIVTALAGPAIGGLSALLSTTRTEPASIEVTTPAALPEVVTPGHEL